VPGSTRRAEIALLVLGVVLALLLAEAAVRLLSPPPGSGGYAPVRTDTRERRPMNARGYRDLERAIPKPAGVRRAVCLGDSFTWGVGVLFDDTWPQRLERLLARERGERWEAVNLGEPGLNTVQEASKLAAEGLAYQPDVVVVGYVLNDSEDENAAERRTAEWVEDQRQRASRPASLLERSALVRLVGGRLRATVENRKRVTGFRAMYSEDYTGWQAGRTALRAIAGMCRERGVPLVVAVFPLFGNALDDGYPFAELHAKVAHAATEAGARVVDLLPQYRGLDWHGLVVDGANDEHPNEVAYRIASQAIVRAVDEVVPRPAASDPVPGPRRP
jgi:hypothetical protein